MTDLYHPEHPQQQQTEHTPISTRSEMPSFYPPTRHRTFLSKHLTDHDDDDPDSIYKEAFIVQIFQHWKIKTLEHQHGINNSGNTTTSNHFSRPISNKFSPVETSTIETISNETSSNDNKDELSNINQAQNSIITMKKRETPLVTSHTRRTANLKKSISAPVDFSNPNLLTPYTKNKCTTATTTVAKKPTKPAPIFIAPKKSLPPPIPRSYSSCSFDESAQTKRKVSLVRQNAIGDDQNPIPISPSWAPAPPTTPTRLFLQTPSSSLDDDESSSDENIHESLLIRSNKKIKNTAKTKEKHPLSIHSNLIIPTAIFITNPHGHTRIYDSNNDSLEEPVNTERMFDNDFIQTTSSDHSSSSGIVIIPPSNLDKHALHSIGEEEEEESTDKENNDGIILSKALDRIEAFTRSRQTISNVQDTNTHQDEHENVKRTLGRRWSDGFVSDDEDHIRSPQSLLVKMASTSSLMKQPVTPPVKLSKTKYLLIKLHLAPSPYKDDDSNISSLSSTTNSSSRKRTVRRSSDKKRYQTR